MTRMAADSPAWPFGLKLGVDLVASTSTVCHFFPYSWHTGASVSWIKSSPGILITLSRDTGHNSDVPSIGWSSWTAFHFPLPKKAEILSRPVIEFTPIKALMKQWLTLPGSSCIESSRLFPFSCSTFSKSRFCKEQAVGQRHQYQWQFISVHHTVIPARMPSMENNTRISLFVT